MTSPITAVMAAASRCPRTTAVTYATMRASQIGPFAYPITK